MDKLTTIQLPVSWAACLALVIGSLVSLSACTSSDFAGTAGKDASANLRGKSDAADGGDTDTGDTDAGDSDAGDAGDSDGDGDSDAGDSDGDSDSGDTDSDGDSDNGDTDVGGDDTTINPDKNPGELAESDDEVKSKYLHDGTVTRTNHDDSFTLKIETMIKGKAVQTNTLTFGGSGNAKEGTNVKMMCRTNKSKKTTADDTTYLRITINGKVSQVVGSSSCTKVRSNTGGNIQFDADTDGSTSIGSCTEPPGSDETIMVDCPDTKLKIYK